jgi:hypothetical protein
VRGAFVFGPSSKVHKDLGQHIPNRRKINAVVPVGIGSIGKRSNTNNNKNDSHFSLSRTTPELQPTKLIVRFYSVSFEERPPRQGSWPQACTSTPNRKFQMKAARFFASSPPRCRRWGRHRRTRTRTRLSAPTANPRRTTNMGAVPSTTLHIKCRQSPVQSQPPPYNRLKSVQRIVTRGALSHGLDPKAEIPVANCLSSPPGQGSWWFHFETASRS